MKKKGARRSRGWRVPRWRKRTWAAAAFGAFAAVAIGLAVVLAVFASRPGPSTGQRFVVDVPAGLTPRELAALLAEEGLVSSELLMSLYLGLSGGVDVVPGEHLLPGGATPGDLKAMLVRSPRRPGVKVTVPEGFHRFAIADRLEASGVCARESFLRATADPLLLEALEVPGLGGRTPESAEGYLFPATYELQVDSAPVEIVKRLVNESHTRWKRVAEKREAALAGLEAKLGWTRAEIVTLASMIEKEAAVAEERPIIASVFLNRLTNEAFAPKLLQCDPTTAYGCVAAPDEAPTCGDYRGKVTGPMNRDRLNRYSTYTREGLPPGPIANPGQASIDAVLEPASTSYFYFVARGGGRHAFSETLEQHNRSIGGGGD